MKAIDLLEKFPKAADAIKEFYYGKMIESMSEDSSIPDDFKEREGGGIHVCSHGAV